MLRKSVIVGLALAVALAGAAVVQATGVVTQNLKVVVSPSKAGTTKKPKPVTLKLHLYSATSDGSKPPASNKVVIYLARGLLFNGAKFKSCSLATLNSTGPSACPAQSKVGGGTATGNISPGQDEQLSVTLFNGPKGKALEIYVQGTSPAAIAAAFESKLSTIKGGPYGYKLTSTVPQNLYEPAPGLFTPLTDFNVAVHATTRVKGKQYGLVATTSCPKTRKWPFKATYNYANSPAQDNAQTTVKCSK
jgi:hypothetical protein